ncbi:glutamate formimidoyltransferase [Caldiplasma sukawensis]
MGIIECVPNFSEGRRKEIIDQIVKSIESVKGVKILDTEMDSSHNRSVVTFVCSEENALEAAFNGIKTASELIDMNSHSGEHPRFGSADVIPFIPVQGVSMKKCIELAKELGKMVGEQLKIPVYLYGEAAIREERKNLENIRNKNFQFEQLREHISEEKNSPDFGPKTVGKSGASIIGAREFLIAYNVNLKTQDMEIGKKIAKALRAKDGGLTFVKALPFFIKEKNCVQISMNLTNFRKTPIYRAFELVRLEANRYGVEPFESEIVGLVPLDAISDSLSYFLKINDFKSSQIFEKKVWE